MSEGKMARGHYLRVTKAVKERKRRRLEKELREVNDEIKAIQEELRGGGKDE